MSVGFSLNLDLDLVLVLDLDLDLVLDLDLDLVLDLDLDLVLDLGLGRHPTVAPEPEPFAACAALSIRGRLSMRIVQNFCVFWPKAMGNFTLLTFLGVYVQPKRTRGITDSEACTTVVRQLAR